MLRPPYGTRVSEQTCLSFEGPQSEEFWSGPDWFSLTDSNPCAWLEESGFDSLLWFFLFRPFSFLRISLSLSALKCPQKPQAHVGQMKQISFCGRQLLFYLHALTLVITHVWTPSRLDDHSYFWCRVSVVRPQKARARQQASSLFHEQPFLVLPSIKMPNTGRISTVTEISGGQTVAPHQHQMPSAFKTTDSCPWYKTPDISGVRYPKKRSEKKMRGGFSDWLTSSWLLRGLELQIYLQAGRQNTNHTAAFGVKGVIINWRIWCAIVFCVSLGVKDNAC